MRTIRNAPCFVRLRARGPDDRIGMVIAMSVVDAMLRLTPHLTDGEYVITLEGCLCGAWVAELSTCWNTALRSHPGHAVRIDLSDVTHVDAAGRELMTLMIRAGARFAARGVVMADLVREITESIAREGGR